MRVPRIYTGQDLTGQRELTLDPGPSAHLARVLRMGPGQPVCLFDGRGGEYEATITYADKRAVSVELTAHHPRELESPLAIELAIGVSRGGRMDWVLQKATELGVQRIVPLVTERTEVRLRGERAAKKLAHWHQVTISACEQCGRNSLPEVLPLCSWRDWLRECDAPRRFVLHHRAAPSGNATAPTRIALAVGPEGGLSDSEIEEALAAGFEALTLGPRVLRTETAPLAALAILQARWGDMQATNED